MFRVSEGRSYFLTGLSIISLSVHLQHMAGAVNQRTAGPSEASRYGAVAVIVRSMTQSLDNFPHTGVTRYAPEINKIPAVAVSTSDAELLSQWLKTDPSLNVHLVSTCKNLS